ncbi:akirin-like [Arctopsyche grandis]|uniref:akirin-like n=1 Tax=Arctopsyche grandis TaxID=121162 RepID=UPI00406DA0A0
MACATLKRSPDWEGVAQLPAKRRRCAPLHPHPHPHPHPLAQHSSHQHQHHQLQQQQQQQQQQQRSETVAPSPFAEPTLKLTPERMAQEICDEITRLQHRRQLRMSGQRVDSDGSSSGSEGDSPRPPHTRVLFTFKQVRMICERMLREQEAALRAEYEAALCGKLAEQYESFVRFSQDQVQRRHLQPENISYLS